MDVSGWLQMPSALGWTAAGYILPLLLVDAAQYLAQDEHVLLRLPLLPRALVYAAAAYAFILLGNFESNAFIYFQF